MGGAKRRPLIPPFFQTNLERRLRRRALFFRRGGCASQSFCLCEKSSKGWKCLAVPLRLSDDYGGNGDLSIVRVLIPGTVQMTLGYR